MSRRDDVIIELKPDELDAIKQKSKDEGIIIGREHSVPAQDTIKFMEETKTEIAILSTKMDNVIEKIESQHKENKEDHNTISGQQKYTNGKVAELIKWKERAMGALIIISLVLTGIIIPLVVDYLKRK